MSTKSHLEVILEERDKREGISNRDAVMTWLRIAFGLASMTVSYQFRSSGLVVGIILLGFSFGVNYIGCRIILEQSDKHNECNYVELVCKVIGERFRKVITILLWLDISSILCFCTVSCWNLFQFLLLNLGMYREQ